MKGKIVWMILLLGGLLLAASAGMAADMPAGAGQFLLEETGGANQAPLRVFYYRPASWTPDRPVVIVQHGVNRDADRYRDEWKKAADSYKLLVICPEFSAAKYPGERYSLANMLDSDNARGAVQPEEKWLFPVLERVFAEVRQRSGAQRTTYSLYGHSAGAQFVHRNIILSSASQADLYISANAGWYTMPDFEREFPYGLKGVPFSQEQLITMLARPVVVLLGDRDTDSHDKNLRHSPQTDRQGENRWQRGHTFFETARAKAAELGVPFNWRLVPVKGVGHSDAGMLWPAAKIIAGER